MPIRSHPGLPLAAHDLWLAWNSDLLLLSGFVLAALVYWRGSQELWQRSNRARTQRTRQLLAAAGGMLALVVALISPLDALGELLSWAHMAQHTLLALVAAPLLVLGTRPATMLWGLPAAWRHTNLVRRTLAIGGRIWHTLSRLPVAFALHASTLWIWHLPVVYGRALEHELIHVAQHSCVLGSALLFWSAIIRAGTQRRAHGAALLALFLLAIQSSLLSALLLVARRPWYRAYTETSPAWDLTPLQDQQYAAMIMMVSCDLIYLVAALGLLTHWLRGDMQPYPIASEKQGARS